MFYEWLFLLALLATFLLAPVIYGLGCIFFHLNPDWRAEVFPSMDTIKINGPELERILDEQATTIR